MLMDVYLLMESLSDHLRMPDGLTESQLLSHIYAVHASIRVCGSGSGSVQNRRFLSLLALEWPTRVLFARWIASDDAIPAAASWGPSMTQYAFNERQATDNTLTFGNYFRLVGWKIGRATVSSYTSDGFQTIRVSTQLHAHTIGPSVVCIFQSVFIRQQLLEYDHLRRLLSWRTRILLPIEDK